MKFDSIRGISIFLLFKSFTSLNCCLWHCILVWSTPALWSCIQYNFIQNSYEGFLSPLFYWEFLQRNRAQFLKDCNNFMIQKTKAHYRSWETKFYINFVWYLWKKLFHLVVIYWFSLQNNCIGNWCYNNNSCFLFLLNNTARTYICTYTYIFFNILINQAPEHLQSLCRNILY